MQLPTPLRPFGGLVILSMLVSCTAMLGGCAGGPAPRAARTPAELLAAREASDQKLDEQLETHANALLARMKTEYDDHAAGRTTSPPTIDFLIISGGGDWGAFGAGFLKGWERVPPGEMAKPQFDAVTGVSTGALIAPFAFLGDPESTDTIVRIYRNPAEDWVRAQSIFALLGGDDSFANIPGLERELKQTLGLPMIQRIADERKTGRVLAVNTTNIDNQEMCIWDIVAESETALAAGDPDRVHQILLASAALPGAFPPRQIDGTLYIDGGITGNILFGGPRARQEDDTFVARWKQAHPNLPIPKVRYWIIFNNEVRWPPEVVPAKWSAVLARSSTASTRAATLNSMRILLLKAQIAKLKHNADVEVRLVAVPDGWVAPKPGVFQKETMNALADLGEKMGADPNSWRSSVPRPNESNAADRK